MGDRLRGRRGPRAWGLTAEERAADEQPGHRRGGDQQPGDRLTRGAGRPTRGDEARCARHAHGCSPEVSNSPDGGGAEVGAGAGLGAIGFGRCGCGCGARGAAVGAGGAVAAGVIGGGRHRGGRHGGGLDPGCGRGDLARARLALALARPRSRLGRPPRLAQRRDGPGRRKPQLGPGRGPVGGDGGSSLRRPAARGPDDPPLSTIWTPKVNAERERDQQHGRAAAQAVGHFTGLVLPGMRQRSSRWGALPRRVLSRVYLPIRRAWVTRISIVTRGP